MQPRRFMLLFLVLVVLFADFPIATMAAEPTIEASNYPTLRWKFETRDEILTAPIVTGNILLQKSEDGYLYALDIATGAEKWRAELGVDLIETEPVEEAYVTVADGMAYISDTRGRLRAI